MELRSGFPLLIQQYRALLKKNLLLSWRNKRATFLQLFSSLFFIFLIFCIQKAVETRFASSSTFVDLRNPPLKIGPPIPPCEDKYFIKLPCYDFVYSGNSSPNVRRIVASIMANNPGRPIPQQKVRAFDTRGEVDEWLHRNNMVCPGALHFSEINNNNRVISYGVQTNSTAVIKRGNYEDPTFKFQIPLQIAAEREIARFFLGVPNFSWVVNFMEFAHPIVASYSAVDTVGPAFFLAIAMFGFVLQISSLITEKELKLRQAMTMMGLFDTAYWLSWLTWEGLMTLISSLFTVLFGMMFRFDFFTLNDFRIVFLVFFLFQLNMVGFAFMLSAFISKSSSSTTVGFSIFIVGFLTQMVTGLGFPYSGDYSKSLKLFWSLFPPNLLAKALSLLSNATSTSGIRWSGRKKCAGDATECAMTINDVYLWLVGTFLLWFFLAIYLDNIIPSAAGVRKSVFYFLRPGYWTGKGGGKVKEGSIFSFKGSLPALERITPDDEDVLEEENKVKQQTSERKMDPNVSVQIRGLVKTYPGILKASLCCCCKRKETPPYHAVKGLWVNFAKDQLFCLLGPNGAGKTTSISCLTGITPVTGGDALIYGHSVCDSVGMSNIRKIIGVCPQFDILWDVLSGLEHLYLFAMIKGLLPSSIKPIAEKSLAEVKLTPAAKMRSGSYSGGMKRRLSVAIALIGDPKLVILDEPTTGMDPITRRRVWDIIEGAKRGRAILLTTHSMEEADILSDRIGIMAKGRLRCIGTSIRLKSRFGAGFVANVSFASTATTNHEAIKQFFKSRLDILPKEEHKSFLTYIIPHDREKLLTKFFDELEERKGELGISDVQLSLTTLEEVFMNIAKQAELENAVADGSMVTLTLTTSGNSVQIPIGAKFVGIAGTENSVNPRGMMVEVYWEQDDTGALCISGHSQEIPVPPNVQALASLRPKTSQFGEVGPVYGIVYDSKQVAG